jgi:hypothetical protein
MCLLDRPYWPLKAIHGQECGVIMLCSCAQLWLLQGSAWCLQLKSWIFHVSVWDVALLVRLSCFLVGPWQLLNFYGPLNMSCSGHRPMLGVTDAFFFWLCQLHRRQCSFRFWLFLSALVSIVGTLFWIPFSLRATHFYCVGQLFMYEVFMNLL